MTGDITTDFEVTNLSQYDATTVLITPQTPNVTITPGVINQSIPIGNTATFSTIVSGAIPGQLTCFTVTLLNRGTNSVGVAAGLRFPQSVVIRIDA